MKKLLGRTFALAGIALGSSLLVSSPLQAKGNLSLRPTALPELVMGTNDLGYGLSETTYQLETGKAYSLKVRSTGLKEYALRASAFFNSIWLRKVEVGDPPVEIKANRLSELEFEEEGEAEIFFVPIVPGTYEFHVAGLEERGMVGTFIVE